MGPRKTLVIGLVLLSLTTFLTGLSRDYFQLLLFQSMQGLFKGFCFIPAYVVVSSLFTINMGRPVGILDSGVNIDSFIILISTAFIALWFDWWRLSACGYSQGYLSFFYLEISSRKSIRFSENRLWEEW